MAPRTFKIRSLLFALLATGLFAASACNPNRPVGHPGSPPVINTIRTEPLLNPPPRVVGNVRPKKYGLPYLLNYARQQAGTTRPGAELGINADQLSFDRSIGRN